MMIVVNGKEHSLEAGSSVAEVVEIFGRTPGSGGGVRGIAVALNGEVVPRGAWGQTMVEDSDKIELLTAVGGG
jgi:sulfur carrier protein